MTGTPICYCDHSGRPNLGGSQSVPQLGRYQSHHDGHHSCVCHTSRSCIAFVFLLAAARRLVENIGGLRHPAALRSPALASGCSNELSYHVHLSSCFVQTQLYICTATECSGKAHVNSIADDSGYPCRGFSHLKTRMQGSRFSSQKSHGAAIAALTTCFMQTPQCV